MFGWIQQECEAFQEYQHQSLDEMHELRQNEIGS